MTPSQGQVEGTPPIAKVFGAASFGGTPIPKGLQSALFAFLVARANSALSRELLVDALWPEPEERPNVDAAVPRLVSELRTTLGQDGSRLADARTQGHYRLDLDSVETDLQLFRSATMRARRFYELDEHDAALAAYESALDLFKGSADLEYLEPFPAVQAEYLRLLDDYANSQIALLRIKVDHLAQYDDAAVDLGLLFAASKEDEEIARLLATALAGQGKRQAALDVVEETRRGLDESGHAPGEALRELQQKLLLNWSPPRNEKLARWRTALAVQDDPWAIPPGTEAHLDVRLRSPATGLDRAGRAAAILESLAAWALSNELLELFDSWPKKLERPAAGSYREVFAHLVEQTDTWNLRMDMNERWAQVLLEQQSTLAAQTIDVARRLGMREATLPLEKSFDLGISLGGARRAPLCRTKWLAAITDSLEARLSTFAYATSFRPVAAAERSETGSYAPHAETEFDLMHSAGLRVPRFFGHELAKNWEDEVDHWPPGSREQQHVWAGACRVRRYESAGRPPAWGIAAPSEDPREHRPRTPDTLIYLYDQLAERGVVEERGTVLLATSAIYVPYQQIEALRVIGLPRDLYVETVAFPRYWNASTAERPIDNLHDIGNYVQEIRSALQACQRLADDFPEGALPCPRSTGAPM